MTTSTIDAAAISFIVQPTDPTPAVIAATAAHDSALAEYWQCRAAYLANETDQNWRKVAAARRVVNTNWRKMVDAILTMPPAAA